MSFGFFRRLSRRLKERPLLTNMVLSTFVGFCGDVICQTVYEPATMARPPLTRELLPDEGTNSPFLVEVTSPYLALKNYMIRRRANANTESDGGDRIAAASKAAANESVSTTVLLDLRRSAIFSSFTFMFGVPFFLQVYRQLDRIVSPYGITKKQAIFKGFLCFIAAQVLNPVFLTYVTTMDHFFIYRDGRDGRRRVKEISSYPWRKPKVSDRVVLAGEDDDGASSNAAAAAAVEQHEKRAMFSFRFSSAKDASALLEHETVAKMGRYYRFVDNLEFNFQEYSVCVIEDTKRKLYYDYPDMVRYGFVFWGVNWLPMFYYIPGHFRLVYASVLQVAWSGIMSHLMHRVGAQRKADAQEALSA